MKSYAEYETEAKAAAKKRFQKWLIPLIVVGGVIGGAGGAIVGLAGVAVGAAAGCLIGLIVQKLITHFKADREADQRYTADWCTEHGCQFVGEASPENGPFAGTGTRQESSMAIEGTLNELPTFFYNFSYWTLTSNGKTTYEVEHPFKIMQIWGRELPAKTLTFSTRGFFNKLSAFDKLDSATTSQKQVDLESIAFNKKFDLEIDDNADEVWIRQVFDPTTIDAVVAGSLELPDLRYYDRCFWLIEGGHYQAEKLDEMQTWQTKAANAIKHLSRIPPP